MSYGPVSGRHIDLHNSRVYPASAACGQLGQSYEHYQCSDMADLADPSRVIPAAELQCAVDPTMEQIVEAPQQKLGKPRQVGAEDSRPYLIGRAAYVAC